MMWWLAAAVVVGSLVLLGAVAASLRGRVAEFLRVAQVSAERLAAQAGRLQAGADALQERVAAVERHAAAASARRALTRGS